MQKIDKITEILKEIEQAPVECDGFARLASYLLTKNKIGHQIMVGSLSTPMGKIPLHFWVVVDDLIIDYRARMWLGENAPHGVFSNTKPDSFYQGEITLLEPTTDTLFEILSMPFPIDLTNKK